LDAPIFDALRRVAKVPALTGLVILTLAPGIGAHIAIFSLVNVLFLKSLPLKDAASVVGVYQTRNGSGYFPLSYADYVDYRDSNAVFSELASHYPTAPLSFAIRDDSIEANGSVVSGNYFSVLGIEPAVGRFFQPQDDAPGVNPVAVISHRLWQSRFRGRRDVVGQVVKVNGIPFTVVGVAPASFEGVLLGIPTEVWLPNSMSAVGYRWCDTRSRDCTWLSMIGRLKPGRTLAAAQAEMTVLSRGLEQAHLDTNQGLGLVVTPLRGVHPSARQDTRRLATLLLAGVTLLVAVACANASSLLLMRSLTRRKEIAVRLALGATRARVVSPFIGEALVQALLGGAAGVLMASWFERAIVGLYPSDVPLDLGVDVTVLGYALLLSVVIGLIVGLVPGLQATRPSLVAAFKEEASVARHGRPRLLGLLMIVQVAISFVLLAGTGLLARSVTNALRGGGFDPSGVVVVRLRPRLIGYDSRRAQAFSREAIRRLAGLPGVASVSLGLVPPPWPPGGSAFVGLPGQKPSRPEDAPTAAVGEITPRYFQTFGAPVLRGRDFSEQDAAGAAPVAIVSQTLAHRLWPNDTAIGQPLVVDDKTYEVVGLVADMGYHSIVEPPPAAAYLPYWQNDGNVDARLFLRAAGDSSRLLPVLRRELRAIDSDVPVVEVETMASVVGQYLAPVRVAGYVLGASAGLALLLSAIGLYGILVLAVAQRTRDIGIRMAIGASRGRVVALVVRDVTVLISIALGLGLVTALGTSRVLAHYLYGVSPRDPWTLVAALLLLAFTAAIATWLPARRASQIDPRSAMG
jgi:putative ABC transport system permease protein